MFRNNNYSYGIVACFIIFIINPIAFAKEDKTSKNLRSVSPVSSINVSKVKVRKPSARYTRVSAGVCASTEGISPMLRGTRGPVVYNHLKRARTFVCSVDIGPALVPVNKISHVLLRAADNSFSWEVIARLCYHDTRKDRKACGTDASTAQKTELGMYHYVTMFLKPPQGSWTVGATTAWLEVDIVKVSPDGTFKGGIHSFTVYGY